MGTMNPGLQTLMAMGIMISLGSRIPGRLQGWIFGSTKVIRTGISYKNIEFDFSPRNVFLQKDCTLFVFDTWIYRFLQILSNEKFYIILPP
jgi:hypothetical protein